jgi:hypothetical protein
MKARAWFTAGALVFAPLVLHAQDADRSVAGGGISVAGWKGKVDERPAKQGKSIKDSKFDKMGSNFVLKVGPAGIYWSDANTASGDYTVKASFSEKAMKAQHPHSYGVFIGGNDLDDDSKQTFMYCIVYGTGKYSIKYFNGLKVTEVANMVEHPAIKKADANGDATNEVGWRVKGGTASCMVNGQEIKSLGPADIVGAGKLSSTNGKFGYRVSHNLDLTVTPLAMSK